MSPHQVAGQLPRCPAPEHAGYRVWRDDFQGKAPARRQRFRCVNPLDRRDAHRFALPVPRAEAHDHRCLHCQQDVPSHARPVVAGGYRYLSKVVVSALADVAKGQTYSEASLPARAALAQAGDQPTEGVKFSPHGQLAADWTEVFAGVVTQAPTVWPGVVLLDSTKFWRRQNSRQVPAFTLLFAYGYDVLEGPHPEPDPWAVRPPELAVNGRLLRIGLATKQTETAWCPRSTVVHPGQNPGKPPSLHGQVILSFLLWRVRGLTLRPNVVDDQRQALCDVFLFADLDGCFESFESGGYFLWRVRVQGC